MKRYLTVLGVSLAVGLLALGHILNNRTNATAPPTPAKRVEAEAAPRIAGSRISHVTVYPDSALVTRDVEVPAGQGLMELVVSPLPVATVPHSLYTESADGMRVLTTRFRSQPVKEDTRDEVRKIDEEIKKLHQQQRKIQADIAALKGNLDLLGNLEKFTSGNTTAATEKGKLDSEATIGLSKYLMEGRLEKGKQMHELTEKQMEIMEHLSYAEARKNNLTTGTSKIERDAVLVVDKVNAAAGKVKLNYLVGSASWKPQYKFRAGKTARDAVSIEYLAALEQHTGEDWERVEMTLSTAQPMLNAAPPELQALAVHVVPRGTPMPGVSVSGLQQGLGLGFQAGGRPGSGPGQPQADRVGGGANLPAGRLALMNPMGNTNPDDLEKAVKDLRKAAQDNANLKREKDANELSNYASLLDQARDLAMDSQGKRGEPARRQQVEGPSVTYHLASKLSVPSRRDDQVIEVARLDLEPDYFYKAVPVLSPHVYRQAHLENRSKMVLLPGEATMYHGTDFVGRMSLPLVAIGERFTVGFGAEPQLQVQRQMVERTKTMQAGNQVLKYEYRILITSYKGEKVKLQVWDRLPHAEKEAMGVTLVKTTPELCKEPLYVREERSQNLLRWDVDVDPDMKGDKAHKIQYEFQLELDRQATLGSFQTK